MLSARSLFQEIVDSDDTSRSAVLAAGIHARYAFERLCGWRRMVSLRMPERGGALDGPAATAPAF